MRTCRTCGKSIEHRRADAKHCDDGCRARYGQGIRAKSPPAETTEVFSGGAPQTDPVFSDLAAALAAPPEPAQVDTDSVSTPRPPREPPAVTRPPGEHLREPDLDMASLDKRVFELELRMSAYDMDQPWQDWFGDAQKLVDEAKKLVDRAKQGDAGLRERVERLEKAHADAPTMTKIGALIDDKLRHVWREIDKVDKATASRQSVEKLGEQIAGLAQARAERRPDPRPDSAAAGGTALAHVHQRIDGVVDAHNWLQRKVLALVRRLAGPDEGDGEDE